MISGAWSGRLDEPDVIVGKHNAVAVVHSVQARDYVGAVEFRRLLHHEGDDLQGKTKNAP